jgi:hypothetical protein
MLFSSFEACRPVMGGAQPNNGMRFKGLAMKLGHRIFPILARSRRARWGEGDPNFVSALGFPVPSDVRVVGRDVLVDAIDYAKHHGFSRQARGVPVDDPTAAYLVIPYVFEPTPERSWRCIVALVPGSPNAAKTFSSFGSLDVSETRYEKFQIASSRLCNQMFHWLAWQAFHKAE